MNPSRRAIPALMLVAHVLWFGGLFRLGYEAVIRVLPQFAPNGYSPSVVLAVAGLLVLVAGIELLIWRWPPYRDFRRQTYDDLRIMHGLPPADPPKVNITIRRTVVPIAIVLLPAAAVAALLPGVVAAAIAVVGGLLLRVAASLITLGTAPNR